MQQKQIPVINESIVIEEIEAHNTHNILLVERDMVNYPEKLKPYGKMFPIVSIKGNINLLNNKTIGIIGARQCSIVGKEYTKLLTKKLRKHYTTVSGLAIGIDTIVAENSLNNHVGVVPGGINTIYPSSAKNLYESIVEEGGCLISCQPFNQSPKKTLFAIRNQLIAALSDGLIITESKNKSGSLQTANFILDYNKPLLVVPGHPLDENYSGNNLLLKNRLALPMDETVDLDRILKNNHWVEDDYWNSVVGTIDLSRDYSKLKKDIVNMVSLTPVDINKLSHYFNSSIGNIVSCCMELELDGKVIINHKMEIMKNFIYNSYDDDL